MPNVFDALAASNKAHVRLFDSLNTLPVAGVLYPLIIGGRLQNNVAATTLVKATLAAYLEENPVVPPATKENHTPHDDTHSQIPRNDTKSHDSNSSIPHPGSSHIPSDATNIPMPSNDTHVDDTKYPEPDIEYYSPSHAEFTELPEPQPPLPQSAQSPQDPPIPIVNPSAATAPATTQPAARAQKPQTPQAHPVRVANPPAAATQPRAARPSAQKPQAQNPQSFPVANPPSQTTNVVPPQPRATRPQPQRISQAPNVAAISAPKQPVQPPPPPKRKATAEDSTRNVKPKQTHDDLQVIKGAQLGYFILSLPDPPVLPAGYVLLKRNPCSGFKDYLMLIMPTGVPPPLPFGFVQVEEGALRGIQQEAAALSTNVDASQFSSRVPVNTLPAPAAAPPQPARLTAPPMPTSPAAYTFAFATPSTVRSAAAAAPTPKSVKPPRTAHSMPSQSGAPATTVGVAAAPRPVTQPSRIPVPAATGAVPQFTFRPPANVDAAAAPKPVTQPARTAPSTASYPHQSTFGAPSAMPGNLSGAAPQMSAGPSSLESIPAPNFWNTPFDMNIALASEPVDFFGITL